MKLFRITTVALKFVAILFLHGLAHAAYAGSSAYRSTPRALPKLGHPALEQILSRAANFPGEIVAASEELSFTTDGNAVATATSDTISFSKTSNIPPPRAGRSSARGDGLFQLITANSSNSAPFRLSKRVSVKFKRITIDWSDK